jgi:hypothetical protein
VGSYPISVSLNDPSGKLGNYVVTTNSGVLLVTNALLTVSANNTNKSYGQAVVFAGSEFTATGLVNTDSVSSATLSSAGAAADAAAGGYPITITDAAGDGGLTNYLITYMSGTLTVTSPGKITITSVVLVDINDALIAGTGDANVIYTIQASSDLINWQSIGTATAGAHGAFEFEDSNIANFPSRFYRMILVVTPPG